MLEIGRNNRLFVVIKELIPASLVLLFIIKIYRMDSLNGENVKLIYFLGYIALFFIQRIANRFFPRLIITISFYLILSLCFVEALKGIIQVLSSFRSHTLVVPTGDFVYSAPYGGLLALLISMLFGYYEQAINLMEKCLIIATITLSIPPLILTGSRSSWIALIVVLFLFLCKRTRIGSIVQNNKWLFLFVPLLGGFLYYLKKPSADSRWFINKVNLIALIHSGIDGNGPSTYPGVYGEYQTRYFLKELGNIEEPSAESLQDDCKKVVKSLINNPESFDNRRKIKRERLMSDCPDFAYNEFIRIGIEYGLLALGLVIGLLIISIHEVFYKESLWRYGLTSIVLFSLFSFPFNYISFRLLFVFLLSQGYSLSDGKSNSLILYESFVCMGIIAFVFTYKHEIQMRNDSMQLWHSNLKWYRKEKSEYLLEDGNRIIEWYKNPSFLYCYGEVLNKHGYYEKSDSVLSLCLKYDNKPQSYNLLGDNCLMRGDIENAEKYYSTAFMMVPNRMRPLYLLAKLYYDNNDTCSFINTANFVESFTPKIENDITKQYRQDIRSLMQTIIISSDDNNE